MMFALTLEFLAQTFAPKVRADMVPTPAGWAVVAVGADGVSVVADGLSMRDAIDMAETVTGSAVMAPRF